jgi:hypothetical protein
MNALAEATAGMMRAKLPWAWTAGSQHPWLNPVNAGRCSSAGWLGEMLRNNFGTLATTKVATQQPSRPHYQLICDGQINMAWRNMGPAFCAGEFRLVSLSCLPGAQTSGAWLLAPEDCPLQSHQNSCSIQQRAGRKCGEQGFDTCSISNAHHWCKLFPLSS